MKRTYFFNAKFERVNSLSEAKYLYLLDALEAENLQRFCEIHESEKPFLNESFGTFYWNENECKWENIDYKMNLLSNMKQMIFEAITKKS